MSLQTQDVLFEHNDRITFKIVSSGTTLIFSVKYVLQGLPKAKHTRTILADGEVALT